MAKPKTKFFAPIVDTNRQNGSVNVPGAKLGTPWWRKRKA